MKKRMREIKAKKTDKGKLLNYSERCSINSYVGWMLFCDHYRMFEKYVDPITKSLNRYYYFVIVKKNKKRLKNYYNKLIKKKFMKI